MTLTPSDVAKLQRHNADLVKENETLTRDNAGFQFEIYGLNRQICWLETCAKGTCTMCKNYETSRAEEPCKKCMWFNQGQQDNWELTEPPVEIYDA